MPKLSPKAQISGGKAVRQLPDQRVEPPSLRYGVPGDNAFHLTCMARYPRSQRSPRSKIARIS